MWTPESFTIRTVEGDMEEVGFVRRPFAVHRGGLSWRITHLPTGLSLVQLSGEHRTSGAARAAADRLLDLYPGWSTVTPANSHTLAPMAREWLDILEEEGLRGAAPQGEDFAITPRDDRRLNGYGLN